MSQNYQPPRQTQHLLLPRNLTGDACSLKEQSKELAEHRTCLNATKQTEDVITKNQAN